MTTQAQPQRLLEDFPAHSYEQWRQAAEALLKGASFEKLLVSKTYEDITIQPIYRREDIAALAHCQHLPGADSLIRGSRPAGFLENGWEISQELRAATPAELQAQIQEGLQGGQTELNIVVGCGQQECCRGGVAINSVADVQTACAGVRLDCVATYWQCGPSSLPVAALLVAAAQEQGIKPSQLRGGFDNDPLSELLAKGKLRHPLSLRFDHIASLTDYAAKHAPQLRTISLRGDAYQNAGASATQELAYVFATLVTYLEEMKARGLEPATVLPRVRITLAVGSDYFMEIAKIRAARGLWSKVAAAYGVTDAPVHIHAMTSRWNKTAYDAHTNMLRVTAEAFAAVVAGVDSLHIGPYDEISGATDEFSRRIARNIHIILREECGLDKVIDPAGGSTYIEALTAQIATKSWEIFQQIEANGGMLANIEQGHIQDALTQLCQTRFQNIRRRKDKIVGTNIFPDLKGKKLAMRNPECQAGKPPAGGPPTPPTAAPGVTLSTTATMLEQAIAAASHGASKASLAMATGLVTAGDGPTVTAMPPHRAAEEYEVLRDASAAFLATTGAAPAILQVNIGPSRKYRLRADWTSSFFEAAGFQIDGTRDFAGNDEAVAALTASPANIAVITSDDATYAQCVEPLAAALKAAKPGIALLVAGAPGDHEAAWRAAGVDDFVNVRSNNYELNRQLLAKAGVI